MSLTPAPELTIQLASDLHLEFIRDPNFNYECILKPSAQVLILAGDIASPLDASLERFLSWCAPRWERIYFVHGNHELYNLHRHINEGNVGDVHSVVQKLSSICMQHPNVVYLNNAVDVYKGVCFIGSTLW